MAVSSWIRESVIWPRSCFTVCNTQRVAGSVQALFTTLFSKETRLLERWALGSPCQQPPVPAAMADEPEVHEVAEKLDELAGALLCSLVEPKCWHALRRRCHQQEAAAAAIDGTVQDRARALSPLLAYHRS